MRKRINILLQLQQGEDIDELEMSIPVLLLYSGFKISFLTTAAMEEMLFKLIVDYFRMNVRLNADSNSLEELLLSFQHELVIKDGGLSLTVSHSD
jgi:hypothetical protein